MIRSTHAFYMLPLGVAALVYSVAGKEYEIPDSVIVDDIDMDTDTTVMLQLEVVKQEKKTLQVSGPARPKHQQKSSSCDILEPRPEAVVDTQQRELNVMQQDEQQQEQGQRQLLQQKQHQTEKEQEMQEHISTDKDIEQQELGFTLVLRGVLQVAILFIFADGLRRYQDQARESKMPLLADTCAIRPPDKSDAMITTIRAGNFKAAHTMVKDGADVTAEDIWGCTPLHATAASIELVAPKFARLLLQKGAQVDARDAIDETPLFMAARAGNHEVVDILLEFGAEVNAANMRGWTPLVAAAQEGHEQICNLFLSRGASVAGDVAEQQSFPPLLIELLNRR